MQTEVWAHRGSSHVYTENTLAAFKQAIDDGAEGIELDVQRTKDGTLVVYHDENLKRLTDVNAHLWELTWNDIQELNLSSSKVSKNLSDAKIPLLEDVLELMRGTELTVNIELKNSINFYSGMEKEVLECVIKVAIEKQVLFSSFNHQSMHLMSSLAGSEKCAILTSDIQFEPWHYTQSVGVQSLHPTLNSLQQKNLVQECRERDIKVNVWTADQEPHIYAALLLGVDAIITNKPKKAIALRKQMQQDGGKKALESVKSLGLSL